MLSIPKTMRIFVASAPCDMRRQFDGLAALAREALGADARSGDLFVFRNRRGDMLKMLFHDSQGFCLVAKRLDRGSFSWLEAQGAPHIEVDAEQLARLLSGTHLEKVREAA